jgi:hypothetical protein
MRRGGTTKVRPSSTRMRRVARAQFQAGRTSKYSASSTELCQTKVSGTMAAPRASKPRYDDPNWADVLSLCPDPISPCARGPKIKFTGKASGLCLDCRAFPHLHVRFPFDIHLQQQAHNNWLDPCSCVMFPLVWNPCRLVSSCLQYEGHIARTSNSAETGRKGKMLSQTKIAQLSGPSPFGLDTQACEKEALCFCVRACMCARDKCT